MKWIKKDKIKSIWRFSLIVFVFSSVQTVFQSGWIALLWVVPGWLIVLGTMKYYGMHHYFDGKPSDLTEKEAQKK